MTKNVAIDDAVERLAAVLPAEVGNLRDDLSQSFREILQNFLSNMNLVTREEFDIQAKVLARTREKLQILEQQVASLERA